MNADVNGDLLAVVVDLLVEGALQHHLALGQQEALLGRGGGRPLLVVNRSPLGL